MLAFAGIIGYASISAYQRNCAAKKVLSRTNTDGYNNVMVIYKSRLLCPNLEATVIGFKDNYIGDSEKNKLLNDALKSNNPVDIIDGLRQFKSDTVMESTAYELVSGKPEVKSQDGHVLHKERNWVVPALMPGGLSVFKYKRSPTTNELVWNGNCRTWNQCTTTYNGSNVTYHSPNQPPQ
jgi:hypothetical protein